MKNIFKTDPDAPEKEVDKQAQKLFDKSTKRWKPCFPWVAVRLLQRTQTTKGGIVLPEHVQNKTVHEGIVMRTWEPIWAVRLSQLIVDTDRLSTPLDACLDGSLRYASALRPGDHVLFPHWAGLPLPGLNQERYRIVKEQNWLLSDEGGIFATVQYSAEEEKTADDKFIDWLQSTYKTDARESAFEPDYVQMLELLKSRYILVPKEGQSVTLSGV